MYFSYIDPGTGSMLISATIALVSVGFFMLKGVIYRKFNIGGDKGEMIDPNTKFGLVFFSEGRQYWNVFYPLLDECEERKIKATFFTSDKEDPALKAKYEYIDIKYIGSGREAYFILNRLRADMVVMTTPGLDVLEIKRSPHVKHYTHITHATGCFAGYKSYGTDYFDSIMVGGNGDIPVIRELESLRGLHEKEIGIVGITYLDELRKKIDEVDFEYNLFPEKRKTILVSPTWSNHGLLSNYGHEILGALRKTDYNVIIRPHPQSYTSDKEVVEELMEKYPANERWIWNRDVENINALAHTDLMISDFSGIIFDFFTIFKKPILTMNSHYEKRGRDSIDISTEPWDVDMLDKIGKTIHEEDIDNIVDIIEQNLMDDQSNIDYDTLVEKIDMHPNNAKKASMDFIEKIYNEVKVENVQETEVVEDSKFKLLFKPVMLLGMFIGSLLLVGYSYISKKYLLIDGLNQVFFTKLFPYTLIVSLSIFLLYVISSWANQKNSTISRNSFTLKNSLLVLLPMTPIVQYIFANQDTLTLKSSIYVFGFFMIIAFLLIVMIPILLSSVADVSITMAISTSFLYVLFNMASFGRVTSVKVIALILATLIITLFLMLYIRKEKIVIILVSVLFMANSIVSFMAIEKPENIVAGDSNTDTSLVLSVKDKDIVKQPDVYLLVYDAYANEETMKQYDYDNSEMYDYFLNDGFAIYDGTYSVTATSLATMSHVLNGSEVPYDNSIFREYLAGDAASLELFRKNDYNTEAVFDTEYMTQGAESKYNFLYPDDMFSIDPHKIIIDAILEGEFRFDADFSTISYDDYLYTKSVKLNDKLEKPKFYYSHDKYPGHSQNSGVLLPNETELHLEKLQLANVEIKKDIEAIRAQDRDAIIIVAGDHGPYLTKNGIGLSDYELSEINRLDIQDRFGTFLAISWPEKEYATKYDIQILQDVMPAVFAYMYDDETIFDESRMERTLVTPSTIGGANVVDGTIVGGMNDGEPLFENVQVRIKD